MRQYINILCVSVFILSVFAVSCDIAQPVYQKQPGLSLQGAAVSNPLYLQNEAAGNIEVHVDSPEGHEYIDSVSVNAYDQSTGERVWAHTLSDDGKNGDIIAGDGRFFALIPGGFSQNQTGQFRFVIQAFDVHGEASDTLSVLSEAVDAFVKLPPVIQDAFVTDTLDMKNPAELFFSCVISSHTPDEIDSVNYSIYYYRKPEKIYASRLKDDGRDGDIYAGDGVFSRLVNLADTLRTAGKYIVRFQCTDSAGQRSLPVLRSFYLKSDNDPPVILQVTAPDTLSRTTSEAVILAVQVDDPQGLADIKSVTFNTYRPDGAPAGGNPFTMYDDGTNGDAVAGDGIYSLQIYISSQNALGNYRFDFYAEDFGGLKAGPVTHIMTVVE